MAEPSAREAREALEAYLSNHYGLRGTIVLSHSDGSAGYGKEAFDEIIGKVKLHEHFRDRCHVNRNRQERLSGSDRKLAKELPKAMRELDWERTGHVWTHRKAWRRTGQEEALARLRGYLKRNREYMAILKQRGREEYSGSPGTRESSHRLYRYRMKKQGRAWGDKNGKTMIRILTPLKNGGPHEAMAAKGDFAHKPGRDFRGAIKAALERSKRMAHEGVPHGRIIVDAPSSSAIGPFAGSIA